MSYRQTIRQAPKKKKAANPVLRGVGFLILVGFLAGGFFGGQWFLLENYKRGWVYIPPEFTGPAFAPLLFAKLVFAVLALLIGFSLLTIAYGIIEPVELGEFDAPPPPPTGKKTR